MVGSGVKCVCLLIVYGVVVLWISLNETDIIQHFKRKMLQRSATVRSCTPVTRVFFLKVHKSGSSTAASIIQRFGLSRNLNFVVPNKTFGEEGFNYIGKRGRLESPSDIMVPPGDQQFDLLWNHVVYNRTAFRSIMPADTTYVAIVRHPFQQFVSAFEYYGPPRLPDGFYEMESHQDLIDEYLRHPWEFEYEKQVMSTTRNSLAYDFGFTVGMISEKGLRFQYLEQLAKDFKLVMLLEYFDESLILLKRYLCWDTKDILYFRLNKNDYKLKFFFTEEHHQRHRIVAEADYDIYNYFYTVFWGKIWQEGPEFFSEVSYLKQLLPIVHGHCSLNKTLYVSKTAWHDNFTVDWNDCQRFESSETDLYSIIYNKTVALGKNAGEVGE